ncbi:hypothetical protein [Embleya sp. NPDC005575]
MIGRSLKMQPDADELAHGATVAALVRTGSRRHDHDLQLEYY